MRNKVLLLALFLSLPFQALFAKSFDDSVNSLLNAHYSQYKDKEYFSGIALSVYIPNQPIKDYYIGHVGHEKDSKKIDTNTLFEIGSITKSFTAALVLQLEKEGIMSTHDTVEHWLPEYEKWSGISVYSLLNMTSGLPNYSESPLMNAQQFEHPQQKWKDSELIDFAYPSTAFTPPLKTGYFYTNTGYVLTGMMIEFATQNNLQTEFRQRLIQPAQLQNTFYPVPKVNKPVLDRLARGYGYNQYSNPELVGKNTSLDDLSWAGAAGALISNSTDVIKWVKALFIDNKILDEPQKNKLMELISTATGKRIEKTTSADPRGFALGVSQGYDKDLGIFWFYEGQTEGFRALYIYVPSTGIIVCDIFNSATNGENDHAHELVMKAYKLAKENMENSKKNATS